MAMKETQSLLKAILPGAKVDKNVNKINVRCGISNETVIINVGGKTFETFRSTLYNVPGFLLANSEVLEKYYRPTQKDYFFDRNPDPFHAVLNYARTGSLHIPSYLCGPSVQTELAFWGISDNDIERCCWNHYYSWIHTQKSLKRLEHDQKLSFDEEYADRAKQENTGDASWWRRYQPLVWMTLNSPNSSRTAKVLGWMSLFFVLISIFSFCAETHPFFHQPGEYDIVGRKSIRQVVIPTSTATPVPTAENDTVLSSLNSTNTSTKQHTVVHPALTIIDVVCFVYFATEYAVRMVFAPNKCKNVRRPMCVIDLLALVPDCVEFVIYGLASSNLPASFVRYIPVLRVMRMFRVFRLIRHIPGLWVLFYTLRASVNELILMVVFMLEGMLIFASLIYFAEQGETFTNIPVGFWWALITMTTVGYGDMFPTTPWGYLIGSICALCGLLMIAFTVPVIVSNFIMYYTHVKYAVAKKETDREKRVKQDISKFKKLKRRLSFRLKGDESFNLSEEKPNLRSNQSETNGLDVSGCAISVEETQTEDKNNIQITRCEDA